MIILCWCLIFNGKLVGNDELCDVVGYWCGQGVQLEVWVIWEDGDVECYVVEVIDYGVDVIVVVGGDGMFSVVVEMLVYCEELVEVLFLLVLILMGIVNDFVIVVGIFIELKEVFVLIGQVILYVIDFLCVDVDGM